MSTGSFQLTDDIRVGDGMPLLIAGPCVIESEELCIEIALSLKKTCAELGYGFVFKASFDKANRTSLSSFRGPGIEEGLDILDSVGRALDVALVTDVHEVWQVEKVAAVVDIVQIPAFLCRQTDLLLEAGRSGRTVNIKKGQFLAPERIFPAVDKVRSTGNDRVMVTERGTTFGYEQLVVDMTALAVMRQSGVPVIFDATHSVQLPGANGEQTGGQRELAPILLRAAAAAGVDGFFIETHPEPERALSDGETSIRLADMRRTLDDGKAIHDLVQRRIAHPGYHSRR
jgi:2-dehydro-3-deoxyphosphooctonate aldolase (KDO 8-P synthase)